MNRLKVLVVEDEEAARKEITLFLRNKGNEVTAVQDGCEALQVLRTSSHDLVVSDIRMPRMDGFTLLNHIRQEGLQTPIILFTAHATVEEAVKALHAGAEDYLTKPLNLDELSVRAQRVGWRLSLVRENRALRDHLKRVEFPQMVGAGKAMQDLRKSIARISNDPDVPVMIYGDSGTGKEVVARTIHCQSLRSNQAFIDVSCAALPEELLDSELYGYKKGAFTGAYHDKVGLVQAAQGGTLFLDEVSEMSPRMQSKLLRFLQEHTILPVGATVARAVDVRVIGASNKDLLKLVETGKFRQDLFYRMNVVEIRLVPLQDRLEDIPLLVAHFTAKHTGEHKRPLNLSREVYDCLDRHPWPGNIRELENLVRVLLVSCDKDEIGVEDLPAKLRPGPMVDSGQHQPDWNNTGYQGALHAAIAGFEEHYIRYHLGKNRGNISQTAARIGLSRVALHKKIKQYGLERL